LTTLGHGTLWVRPGKLTKRQVGKLLLPAHCKPILLKDPKTLTEVGDVEQQQSHIKVIMPYARTQAAGASTAQITIARTTDGASCPM
jgi:hypothetical protein